MLTFLINSIYLFIEQFSYFSYLINYDDARPVSSIFKFKYLNELIYVFIVIKKFALFKYIIPPKRFKFLPFKKMDYEGHICLIYGPMFSGKSSELLRKIRRYQHAKKKCLVVNYLHDNRYSSEDVMATHDKITHKALKASKLNDIKNQAMKYDVIGIDEGQFFQDIVDFAECLANKGIVVIIAALDSTFQRKPFGNIINLVPLAQKVYKLTAVCVYCTQPAAFTQRTVQSQEVELVGGAESYKPVCRQCFHNPPLKCSKNTSECSSTESIEEKTDIDIKDNFSPEMESITA